MPKTENGFTYEINDKEVSITEFDGNTDVAEIPAEIEGFPVTELGAYLFSGKACRIIRIPEKVRKIGRYGFYNCRKLESLSFSGSFLDLGSGAFTGCHHIREITVDMNTEESGLKEVLSELQEELCVHLTGAIRACLWFPEYYEEGVENTPARILMNQVHGSGLYYRNCFQGKVFNFYEYDRRFEYAKAQESGDFLREMVYGRLSEPWGLADGAKACYETYLRENYESVALAFVSQRRTEELTWLLENYPLDSEKWECFQKMLDAAARFGTAEMRSMLMEYGQVRFPAKRRSFEL